MSGKPPGNKQPLEYVGTGSALGFFFASDHAACEVLACDPRQVTDPILQVRLGRILDEIGHKQRAD